MVVNLDFMTIFYPLFDLYNETACLCLHRGALFYSNEVQQYAIPFMGTDPSVVKRTQRYMHEELNETPVTYCYI